MTRNLSHSLRIVALAGVAAFAAGLFVPAPAEAQIPTSGVFYGCMRVDRDGDEGKLVRLVAASEPCRRNETRISWNQQGAKGDKGDKGNTGATGAAGATGAQGPAGATGAAGAAGPAGPQGSAGAQGAIGPQGPQGPSGSQGAAGAAGAQGPAGEAGAAGANGETGSAGPKGDKGDTGDNAQGVIAEGSHGGGPLTTPYSTSDQSPIPGTPNIVAIPGGTVVTSKVVTGFRGYMVWGNAAIQFQAAYDASGVLVPFGQSATSATCTLRQGVKVGDTITLDPTPLDIRSIQVIFPPTAPAAFFNKPMVQRHVISLVGDSPVPGNADDIVVVQVLCGSNNLPTNAGNPVLLAPSTSIAVIGMNGVFGLDQ